MAERPAAGAKCTCGHLGKKHKYSTGTKDWWCLADNDDRHYDGALCACENFELAESLPVKTTLNQCAHCGHKWKQHTGPSEDGSDTSCVRCGDCGKFESAALKAVST